MTRHADDKLDRSADAGGATVVTVLGEIRSSEMGRTLPHEHILLDMTRQVVVGGFLSDEKLMTSELKRFADAGGRTIVDCTTWDQYRDPVALRRLAEAVGINIVMGCGHYREPFIEREVVDRVSVDEISAMIVHEFEHGFAETGIRPGVIGEIGSERYITALEERAFRAAARAHLRTGMTVTTHSARWPNGVAHLKLLTDEGMAPRSVVIGHVDTVPESEYHLALARSGCWVQFDTIRRESTYEFERRVASVMDLVKAGFIDQILISQDVWHVSHLHANGGGGYTFVLNEFRAGLLAAGLEPEEFDQITVVNPSHAFALAG